LGFVFVESHIFNNKWFKPIRANFFEYDFAEAEKEKQRLQYLFGKHYLSPIYQREKNGICFKMHKAINTSNILITPVNISNELWVCMAYEVKSNSLIYLDSYSSAYVDEKDQILESFKDYLKEIFHKDYADLKIHSLTSPQQSNGYDCGNILGNTTSF
jgi:hypothetical protein